MKDKALFRGSARRTRDMRIMLRATTVTWLSASCGSSDGTVEGGPCAPGQVLRYESPGCGAEAKPVCGSPQQDACYRAVCSCKGATISRCDYAPEPFATFGACLVPDGGGETTTNPCAQCSASEVCVQSFDGMCGLGTISCRTVSATCRNKLSASGRKSCTSLPECQTELCSSPFQCVIDSPCPNEAPEVALHCYGP
jgi:hypothetical protein